MFQASCAAMNCYLYVVTSLRHLHALAVIAGELSVPTATYLQNLRTCQTFIADILLHHPLVPPHRQGVLVQHGEGEVNIVVVGHPPFLVRLVS